MIRHAKSFFFNYIFNRRISILLVISKAHVVHLYVDNLVFLVHETDRMHYCCHVTVRVHCCDGVRLPKRIHNRCEVKFSFLIFIFTVRLATLIDPSSVISTEIPFLNWNDIVPCSVLLTMSPQLLFFNF